MDENNFSRTFLLGWNDLDSNAHVANTAFMGFMNETRMTYFRLHGLDEHGMSEMKIGPAVLNEEFFYYKELRAGEEIRVDLQLIGRSEDGRFGRIRHELFRDDTLCAWSELTFCWMDLVKRRLLNPLPDIVEKAMAAIPRSETYHVMTKSELRLGRK